MVATRASARARAVTKDQLNDINLMEDEVSREEDQVEEKKEEAENDLADVCRKCEELNGGDVGEFEKEEKEEKIGASSYLIGFAKRVFICTLLVYTVKSIWPNVSNTFWPEEPAKEGKLFVLNDRSFKSHVKKGDHFVMMYAPWCGHCQKMKPIWEKIAKQPGVPGIKLAKVDCTASTVICGEYDVKGYPTLLYFRDGKKIDNYSGDKDDYALKQYIQAMKNDRDFPEVAKQAKAQHEKEQMMPPPKRPSPAKKGKKKKTKTEL